MIPALNQSIQSVIDQGRIGSPVFLRCVVQKPIATQNLVDELATLTTLSNIWMPSPAKQIYALKSTDGVQITQMIQYNGGQTAIISVNRISDPQKASMDLVLIGNKGTIYHETPIEQHHLIDRLPAFTVDVNLISSIQKAIKTRKPVEITEG